MKKKIVFFGFSEVGYDCLKLLLENPLCQVCAVFTHDTDPHEKQWFKTCEELAKQNNIPVYKPLSLKDGAYDDIVKNIAPDLILSLYYRNFIPESIFSRAKLGAYNMHGSYLPRYRGRAPLNWSIINGESYCGVSLHTIEKGFDTGLIADQEKVFIGPNEYVGDVVGRVADAAVLVLKRTLPSLLDGTVKLTPQDESLATYFGKRKPADGLIDFNKTAREVFNLIRGVSRPFPGAFTYVDGKKLVIWKAEITEKHGENAGVLISENPYVFACKDAAIKATDFEFQTA